MAINYAENQEHRVTDNEQPPESPDDMLLPRKAAEYVARKWNRPFSSKDLNNLRNNRDIEATQKDGNMTLWKRSDLDKIIKNETPPKLRSVYGHARPARKKNS